MIFAFLFGVMLVLAQMTALRDGDSVSPLDAALIVAGLLAGVSSLDFARPKSAPIVDGIRMPQAGLIAALRSPTSLVAVWMALAISISYAVNAQGAAASPESLATASIPFYANSVLLLCCTIVIHSRHVQALIWGFAIASLLVGLIYCTGAITQNTQMFYENRFSGLALNPNQSALQALATIVILLLFVPRIPQNSKVLSYVIYVTLPLTLIFGIFTLSDALLLSLPIAIAAGGLLILDRYRIPLWATVIAGIFLFLLLLAVLAASMPSLFGDVGGVFQSQLAAGNQDSDRQLLWRNGLAAWRQAILVGNGPGAWSGLGGPYQGVEAHNSIIDWLSIAGVVGLLPMLYLPLSLTRTRPRLRLFRYMCFVALLVFTMFHFTFRQPVFWFAIAMTVAPFFSLADAPRPSAPKSARNRGGQAQRVQPAW